MIGFRSLGAIPMLAVCLAWGADARAASMAGETLLRAADVIVDLPVTAPDDAAIAHQLTGLRSAIDDLRQVVAAGGWGRVSDGARETSRDGGKDTGKEGVRLDPGVRDPRISEIRYRLAYGWRELAEQPGLDSNLYDPSLVFLVKTFQTQHGLKADGIIGRGTTQAMNRSPMQKLGQLLVAYDKLRQQAPAGNDTRIRVNLPAFTLEIYEGGVVTNSMAVVVGRPDRPTPLFASRVNQITLNPTWTVPAKLAGEDLLPKLRRDPNILIKQGFAAYQGYSSPEPVDLASVNWSGMDKSRLPYWFRQEPGPRNSLGRYKMSMPNDQDIYLHDTPDRHYFQRDYRALSSGCIRVSRPAELVTWLLRHNSGWNSDRIGQVVNAGQTTHVGLSKAVPVSLEYLTAWIDAVGIVQYREDIYGLDAAHLAKLLRGETPPVAALAPTRTH